MKKWISALCLLAVTLLLGGCGESFEPSASCLYVQRDGKLTQAIVESFEKEYYSLEEFRSMMKKELGLYNEMFGEEKITVKRLEEKNDTLYLLLDYVDSATYSEYNEVYCFIGTVEEALENGHSFNMVFKDAAYEEFTAAKATAKKSDHVIVLREEGMVQLEHPVKYVSNNVEVIEEHLVQVMTSIFGCYPKSVLVTPKEDKEKNQTYTCVVRYADYDVTIQSRNTGHYWYLHSTDVPGDTACIIFHKHRYSHPYHQHGRGNSLRQAIRSIQSHDRWQMNGRKRN